MVRSHAHRPDTEVRGRRALEVRAEILKLARLLRRDPDTLAYLEPFPCSRSTASAARRARSPSSRLRSAITSARPRRMRRRPSSSRSSALDASDG